MESSRPRGRGKILTAFRLIAAGAVLAFLLGGLATSVFAQSTGEPRITQMSLRVWPEYDDTRVLVMAQGKFADKAALPEGKATFLVPKGAEINSTCSLDPQENHLSQLWTPTDSPDGKFTMATFPMPQAGFHVEYYHDLVKGSPDKSIAYTFTASYPIDSLSVEIQQPLQATNLSVTPAPAALGNAADFDGKPFKVATYTFSNLTKGQSIDFKIDYTKSDPAPSTTKKTGQQNTSMSSTGGAFTSDYTMLLAGIVGLGVVAAAAYYFYSRRSRPTLSPRTAGLAHGKGGTARNMASSRTTVARRNPARPVAGRANPPDQSRKAGTTAFCTGCGGPIRKTDAFCPACGKRNKSRS